MPKKDLSTLNGAFEEFDMKKEEEVIEQPKQKKSYRSGNTK